LALFVLVPSSGRAAPVRLAILAPDPEISSAADLLTVGFSQQTNVTLLERAEIERVYREQALEASNKGYLKLGQILGADGLCLLETTRGNDRRLLSLRLVAVKPGVVVTEREYPWPVPAPADWGGQVAKQFETLLPKLRVLAPDAIPISVVNLRSSLRTAEAVSREQELTSLLVHRLMREPEVFVLERMRLSDVETENRLKQEEESGFWTGRYLVEGVLDRDGFDPKKITVNARLIPPQGGSPVPIDLSGPAADPAGIVEALVGKVLAVFKRQPSSRDWKPLAEADQYFQEATWALRWGMMREAQQASESAWALGRHTRETSLMRLNSYVNEDWCHSTTRTPPGGWDYFYANDHLYPTRSLLQLARRATELFLEDTSQVVTNAAQPDGEWYDLGLKLLDHVGGLLEVFYNVAEARLGNEPELTELRAQARRVVVALEVLARPAPVLNIMTLGGNPINAPMSLDRLKWLDGMLWFERPEEAFAMHRDLVESGMHPFQLPRLFGWSWANRLRLPSLLSQFIVGLSHSTNPTVRLEGLYLDLVRAPHDPEGSLEASEARLLSEMWEQRQTLFQGDPGAALLKWTEWILREKHGYTAVFDMNVPAPFTVEPFATFRDRVRRDYLLHGLDTNGAAMATLFPLDRSYYTETEARGLLPLMQDYWKRLGVKPPQGYPVGQAIAMLRERAGATNEAAEPGFLRTQVGASPAVSNQVAEAELLVAPRFCDWGLDLPTTQSRMPPLVQSIRLRRDRLWAEVQYRRFYDFCVTFVAVDPETGKVETIPLPPDPTTHQLFGGPSYRCGFEITKEALVVGRPGRLQVYQFRDKRWTSVPVPSQQPPHPAEAHGRLYLSGPESTLELSADSQTTRILGSARRNPPANALDEAGGFADIFPGPGQKILALASKRLFMIDSTNLDCEELPLFPTNTGAYRFRATFSDEGIWFQMTGFGVKHRLVVRWSDHGALDSLLEQQVNPEKFIKPVPELEAVLGPARWEWPAPYYLAAATPLPDGKALWLLHPNKVDAVEGGVAVPPVFTDGRSATLLRFEQGFRRALCIQIRLERNGRDVNSYSPPEAQTVVPVPRLLFIQRAPQGLILVDSLHFGHWLIPQAALDERLVALRAKLAEQPSKP
jgi:hypothetical protein